MNMTQAYIVAAARTAGGRRGGRLSGCHPVDLAAQVLNALVERSGIDPALVDDVILGCVSQIGEQSTNVARNAVLASRLPTSVPGTSIDRQCGSAQQALHFAAQAVMSGTLDAVIAGGVESMTRVPMFTPSEMPRKNDMGYYMSSEIRARYPAGDFSQFAGAEMMVKKYGLAKAELDAYALKSHQLATEAIRAGRFKDEIVPVEVTLANGSKSLHVDDEGVRQNATLEGIASVKLMQEGGAISAANASQICDGASGLLVVNERGLKALGVEPLARIHHMSVIGGDPVIMLDAPIHATQRALKKAGMSIDEIGLYEVNEAFAPVPLAWLRELNGDPDRINVHGGGIALGHPLGATGTKLMTTLIYALRQRKQRYGLQTMCEGGGMANVTIVERL
jgi:acetyl-CoA C-acetyltransferase